MIMLKTMWIGLFVLIYMFFWFWYGGNGKPLSVDEGRTMLADITAMHEERGTTLVPSDFRENMEVMIALDDGREFYMVNLETAKKGVEAEKADAAYSRIVVPLLLKRGSFPTYVGSREGLVLGQFGKNIDRVAIVRYRSLRDFLDMNMDPAMSRGVPFKYASLNHTEVFITRPTISAIQMRLTLALILLVLGVVGLKLIDSFSRRTK